MSKSLLRSMNVFYRRAFTANAPVVVWGSLHGYQYASKEDRLRTRLLWAEWRTYEQMARNITRMMQGMGMGFREFSHRMRTATEALRRFGEAA